MATSAGHFLPLIPQFEEVPLSPSQGVRRADCGAARHMRRHVNV